MYSVTDPIMFNAEPSQWVFKMALALIIYAVSLTLRPAEAGFTYEEIDKQVHSKKYMRFGFLSHSNQLNNIMHIDYKHLYNSKKSTVLKFEGFYIWALMIHLNLCFPYFQKYRMIINKDPLKFYDV